MSLAASAPRLPPLASAGGAACSARRGRPPTQPVSTVDQIVEEEPKSVASSPITLAQG